MKKPILLAILTVLLISFSVVFYYKQTNLPNAETKKEHVVKSESKNNKTVEEDISQIKEIPTNDKSICNENGKIMVLMYHKFSDTQSDGWTRSFDNFKKDLELLYKKNYYPINLSDYIAGKIDVPYGKTPVILTFDDGTAGQLSFTRENGQLVPKDKTAVAIYEQFNKEHPDFPLRGTFYLMSNNFFGASGTLGQRLQYLVDKGFEIGNQTMNHTPLQNVKTSEKVVEEVGGFAKFIDSYLPGYVINSFSIPGGSMTQKFADSVYSGTYQGFKYENKGIVLLFGSSPAKSPIDKELNLKKIPRVRVSGKDKIEKDLDYWIKYFDEHPEEKYISDGDINTFIIKKEDKDKVDTTGFNVVVREI